MLNSLGCDLHVAAARVARVEVLEPAVPVLDGVPQVGGLRRRRAQELLAAVLGLVPKVLGEEDFSPCAPPWCCATVEWWSDCSRHAPGPSLTHAVGKKISS